MRTCKECREFVSCMAIARAMGEEFDPDFEGEAKCGAKRFQPMTNADRIRAMSVREGDFYTVDRAELEALYQFIPQKYYPPRIPPKQWPSKELTGKAMVRGWAIPCRYYPRPLRRSGYQRTFVYPGISNAEMVAMHIIMRKEKKC